MSKNISFKVTDDQHSTSSSDSDSSDSSTVPFSDVLRCETFHLQSMDSESEDACSMVSSTHHINVRQIRKDREKVSRFSKWQPSYSDAYLKEIINSKENMKVFPDQMKTFLSRKYERSYRALINLPNGTFFIYLARSLIVTLNVDNPRARVPRSLVFDACIFSEDNPVVVLSVFDSDKVSERLEMYNTFMARGVTDALRTWCREDISITKRAVTIDSDLVAEIMRLWENPGVFHIPSSLKMWRDKAEKAALALLKSVSVAYSFSLLHSEKEDSDHVWFLSEKEFQFLTNFIDFKGDAIVEGDRLLLQTEVCLRLKKLYKPALLMTTVNEVPQKLLGKIGNSYTSKEELEEVGVSNYDMVITDVPFENVQLTTIMFREISLPDEKGHKIDKTKDKLRSFWRTLFSRKRETYMKASGPESSDLLTPVEEHERVETKSPSYSDESSSDHPAIQIPSTSLCRSSQKTTPDYKASVRSKLSEASSGYSSRRNSLENALGDAYSDVTL